ncbi:MAG TPA: LysM peptidoglycan-binding domain-containing protein [Thermoguttaceae bacterium]|nr:LysM peptidoglycan-binding domain-containing protein [Thermoguttaceae bacterium]
MSSLKNLLVIVILMAVSCGVYVVVTRGPQTTQSTDEASAWSGGPNVQMPGLDGNMPQMPMGNAPMANSPGGYAPQYGQPDYRQPEYGQPGGAAATAMQNDPNLSPPGPLGTSDGMASAPAFVPPEIPPAPVDAQMGVAADPYPSATEPGGPPIASLNGGIADPFEMACGEIQKMLDQGLLADALLELSKLHDSGQVPQEQESGVQELLDQLAGTVIYSRQHLMEDPYTVRPGDTLQQIADLYQVPWKLLANINGIRDPMRLETGQQLKVVRGPFDAQIDLTDMVLTLQVGGRYAGRFAIGIGQDQPNLEGSYVVSGQTTDPVYYGPDQTRAEAGDPNNPLGEFLISLGSQPGDAGRVAIHGTNDPRNLHHVGGPGTIRLGDRDIEDVFGILSIGSRVVIRR